MTTDYTQHRSELLDGYRRLNAAIPETMKGFSSLHRAAVADGALSTATKELMALAIGIAARCDGCITLHTHAALKAGATAEQVTEAIGVAVLMGGGPASVYAIEALDALESFGT
ncbi:MAG: carboxymuconolactone decarboxylase family protein [Actinomycetota bacterium]